MPLTPGTRLGPYEVLAPLGAGGMGEVYKARDTRLDRTVAVKVLSASWAGNEEMKQRFEREAQTIASLNHSHICILHDVGRAQVAGGASGQAEEIDFLVMEHLEGETLAARIARGALALDEALTVAIAIADALDKAHRRGIIHRDLKPSNVMLTRAGPKLLDFGLAKFSIGESRRTGARSGPAALPTGAEVTTPGAVLGTLQYMAPEQLEGAEADARTDIFAFGAIVHEMVTGRKAFQGKSQVLLISAIATSEPTSLSNVQPATPPALDHVVKTCLAKDPQDRWQTASDLLAELEAIAESGEPTAAAPVSAAPRTRARLHTVLAAIAAFLSVGLAAPAFLYVRGPAVPDELRFRVPMPPNQAGSVPAPAFGANAMLSSPDFAVSPDGRLVVVAARALGANPSFFLSVRPVGAVTQQQLSGTEGATQPFWSPDGRWIGFVAGGRLKKVEASGGPPQELCDASDFSGGSWNADGTILYGSSRGLQRVSDQGGTPAPVTTLAESETGHFWPTFLPDTRRYLYLAWSAESSRRAIFSGTLDTNERTKVLAAESNPAYSEPGYLLFARETAVYAQAVDAATLAPEGEPVRVADEVLVDEGNGRGHFSASHNGVLAFFFSADSAAGAGGGLQSDTGMFQLTWVDRTAQPIGTVGTPRPIRGIEVSPDTTRVAVHHHEAAGGNIWVVESRGSESSLTFNSSEHNSAPIWSPDGSHIVFAALRKGKWGLYRKASTPSGTDELLFESDLPNAPMSWSPDGTRLVFWVRDPKTSGDLWVLTMDDRKAAPLLATPFNETHAQISPDGKWLAYTSNSKDRRNEIYVQPFPSGAGLYLVSNNGGDWPRWGKDGQELFYHSIGVVPTPAVSAGQPVFVGPLFAAPIRVSGATLEPGSPAAVMNFRAMKLQHSGGDYSTYAVSPDGQRFLVLQWVPPAAGPAGQVGPDVPSGLTIAMHWTAALKRN